MCSPSLLGTVGLQRGGALSCSLPCSNLQYQPGPSERGLLWSPTGCAWEAESVIVGCSIRKPMDTTHLDHVIYLSFHQRHYLTLHPQLFQNLKEKATVLYLSPLRL